MHNLCYNKITVSVGTINAKLLTFGYYAFGIRNTAKGFQGRIGHFCTCLFFLRFEGDYNSYAGIISFLKLKELANYCTTTFSITGDIFGIVCIHSM